MKNNPYLSGNYAPVKDELEVKNLKIVGEIPKDLTGIYSRIDKVNFELNCLAVSAINGCGMCIEAHTHELTKAGVSKLAIQSSVRIAAVLNATAMGIDIAGQ
jgi:AhpD family alkylhydroperoxidase